MAYTAPPYYVVLLKRIFVALLSLATLVRPNITPENMELLQSKGPVDSGACSAALARFPTGHSLAASEGIYPAYNPVEGQSTKFTIPQQFAEGNCLISIWPSLPRSAILDHGVNLAEGDMLTEYDWLMVQNWTNQILVVVKREDQRGGRGWTAVHGRWITVQIFSHVLPSPEPKKQDKVMEKLNQQLQAGRMADLTPAEGIFKNRKSQGTGTSRRLFS